MILSAIRRTALACCLFALAACEDKHEPTKPTVGQASAVAALAAR
ncbi:hypothetical protein [Massilia glaciei]|nr:hypothetical protein [Massilia glaciei]